MLTEIFKNFEALNMNIEKLPKPGGAYTSVNVRGNLAFVAIQFPVAEGEFKYQGRIGGGLTTEQGCEAAELCAANMIGQIAKYVGIDKVLGLNHIDIYFQQADGWDEGPLVADAASLLFTKVLLNAGRHSRSIMGVHRLPRNFSVGITGSFTLVSL